jgi:NAD(P)-dependent dehydrogenase (short-subunit alcohol dehydrogenase family)
VKEEEKMTSLKNKVSLVTGSARGIGKAIAVRYGYLGASDVVNYSTDEKRAQETVAEIERTGSCLEGQYPEDPYSATFATSSGVPMRRNDFMNSRNSALTRSP